MRMLNAIFHNSGSYTVKTTNWRIVVFYTIFFIYTINCLNSSTTCMEQQQQNQKSSSSNSCGEFDVKNGKEGVKSHSMKEREMLLIRKQRELHNQLRELYIRQKKLKSEREALLNDDDSDDKNPSPLTPNNMDIDDFEFEIPSYCSNCLGDILQPPYKSSLSSEYSRKPNGDDETINLQDDINVPQLSDHNRLESIKHQILLKLGMKNKPNITGSLPKQYIYDTLRRSGEPVVNDYIYQFKSSSSLSSSSSSSSSSVLVSSNNNVIENQSENRSRNDDNKNEFQSDGEVDFDDFYGKPREIITFAEMGQTLNGHHLLEFPTPVDSQTSIENSKLTIHKATLFIKIEEKVESFSSHTSSTMVDDDVSQLHSLTTGDESSLLRKVHKKRIIRKDDDITNDSRYIFSFKNNNKNHIKTNENNENHINNDENERKRKLRRAINNVDNNIKLNSENNNNIIEMRRKHRKNVTLWIFQPKKPIHDVVFMDDEEFDQSFELQMSQQINYDNTGWQNIDITSLVQKWYKNDSQDKNLLRLYVECSGCGSRRLIVHPFSSMINHHQQKQQKIKREKVEIDKSNRPYLAVHIEPATLKRMKRRALDCSVASKSQCCKQRFYVSFKALGWDDWIIAPPGYYANYCSGKCGNGLNRSPDTFPTYYSHVVHEVRKYNKLNGNQLCCAPLKFSSMSLIYFGPDSKIIRRDLPKMVVDECGCP